MVPCYCSAGNKLSMRVLAAATRTDIELLGGN